MIVKICPKHGPLRIEQVNHNKKSGNITYRCKICQKESHAKYYEKHKEKVLAKCGDYRKENKEKFSLSKKISFQKNKHKYRESQKRYREMAKAKNPTLFRENHRIRKKRNRVNLSDGYVRRTLVKNYGLTLKEIPLQIIELKRTIIKIRRITKIKRIRVGNCYV